MIQKCSRNGVNEEEEYRKNLSSRARQLIEQLLDGGDVRVPAENELTALICSCGVDVVMTEVNNCKGSEPAACYVTD